MESRRRGARSRSLSATGRAPVPLSFSVRLGCGPRARPALLTNARKRSHSGALSLAAANTAGLWVRVGDPELRLRRAFAGVEFSADVRAGAVVFLLEAQAVLREMT